jgi:hypothetical protein
VQSRHVAASEHVSIAGHDEDSQLHVAQLPALGPLEVPELHVPVAAHQPHIDAPVHEAQSVCVAQSSGGAAQSIASHAQSPVHEPPVGPVELPERHAPSQNPQPGRAVQASQSVASAHGSVGPVHSLVRHDQSAQAPVEGPVELPVPQRPVSPHQPQG